MAALFNLDTTPVQRNVPGSAGIQGALRRGHRDRPPGRPDLLCNGRLWKYLHIAAGVFLVDDAALRDTADALAIAEQSGDDFALGSALLARGIILANRDAPESDVGYDLLAKARDMALAHRFSLDVVPFVDIHTAMRKVQTTDVDGAIDAARAAIDNEFAPARLAAVSTDPGFVIYEVPLLRMRALLARARGDEAAYRDLVDRYRTMANCLASKSISPGPRQ